jgi:hypothetical protein
MSVLPLFWKNPSKNCNWSSLFRKLTSHYRFLEEAKRCSSSENTTEQRESSKNQRTDPNSLQDNTRVIDLE